MRIVGETPKNSEFSGRIGEKTEILRRYRKKMEVFGRGLRGKLVEKGYEKGEGSL